VHYRSNHRRASVALAWMLCGTPPALVAHSQSWLPYVYRVQLDVKKFDVALVAVGSRPSTAVHCFTSSAKLW